MYEGINDLKGMTWSDSDSKLPADFASRTRVDNTAWRSCTKCAALPTERECCCCRELAHIRHLFSNVEGSPVHHRPPWVCWSMPQSTIELCASPWLMWWRQEGVLYIFLFPIGNGRLCYVNCIPSHKVQWLGFIIDLSVGRVSVPQQKIVALKSIEVYCGAI